MYSERMVQGANPAWRDVKRDDGDRRIVCVGACLASRFLQPSSATRAAPRLPLFCALALSLAGLLLPFTSALWRRGADITLPLGCLGRRAFPCGCARRVFSGVVNLGGASASLYGIGYGRTSMSRCGCCHFFGISRRHEFVVLAADAFSFLVAWEFMSLASWHSSWPITRSLETLRPAMSISSWLAPHSASCLHSPARRPGRGYAFDAIRAHKISPLRAASFLVLPVRRGLEGWTRAAPCLAAARHPAAPSHVSALMSGVMTKVAIYVSCALSSISSPRTRMVVGFRFWLPAAAPRTRHSPCAHAK